MQQRRILIAAALPELCQPFMRKITDSDATAIGHFNMIGYALSGYPLRNHGKMIAI
jgi:ascorbate-specific PTS system EIIC-type component UlaA